MSLTLQDWIDAGYVRYCLNGDKQFNKLADFLLQKLIKDTNGKKYYISVYVYDRKSYPDYVQSKVPEFGFMPVIHLALGDDMPFFEVQMNGISNKTVADVEKYFDKFWAAAGSPYER